VLRTSANFHIAGVMLVATALSGCAAQPETIAADDAALCQYSAMAVGAKSYSQCRARLRSQHGRLTAASASRIEGYALLQAPLPAADVVARCKTPEGPKDCDPGDVTGSIPSEPKR
jgi:hypothetical protein